RFVAYGIGKWREWGGALDDGPGRFVDLGMDGWRVDLDSRQRAIGADKDGHLQAAIVPALQLRRIVLVTDGLDGIAPVLDVLGEDPGRGGRREVMTTRPLTVFAQPLGNGGVLLL